MSEHLDLDALADVLAGESAPSHLEGCGTCREALAELEAALSEVAMVLAALPVPELPEGLAERLDTAIARERRGHTPAAAAATVTPLTAVRTQRTRWLPIAGGLAAAAVLVTGGLFLANGLGGGMSIPTASRAHDGTIARNNTGAAYAKDGKLLASELPALLKGKGSPVAGSGAVAGMSTEQAPRPSGPTTDSKVRGNAPLATTGLGDPLATLRSTAGLAACLSALSDPSDPGVPLALDYASFEGQPALVVVLPSATSDKVDVFVVGATCSVKDAQLLFFTRLAKPA